MCMRTRGRDAEGGSDSERREDERGGEREREERTKRGESIASQRIKTTMEMTIKYNIWSKTIIYRVEMTNDRHTETTMLTQKQAYNWNGNIHIHTHTHIQTHLDRNTYSFTLPTESHTHTQTHSHRHRNEPTHQNIPREVEFFFIYFILFRCRWSEMLLYECGIARAHTHRQHQKSNNNDKIKYCFVSFCPADIIQT